LPQSSAGLTAAVESLRQNGTTTSPGGSFKMKFPRQFVGGILFGLAFGMFIGAALAEGKKEVNYTSMAGVGIILVITGVATARAGSRTT
jgi:hypothetical protein